MSGYMKVANNGWAHMLASAVATYTTVGGVLSETLNQFKAHSSQAGVFQGLFLYKGTPMTQAELDAIVPTTSITAATALPRYSDYLIRFSASVGPGLSGSSLVYSPGSSTAEFSGTATWFIFGSFYSASYPAYPSTPLMVGAVSALGGGGDIEVYTTTITAGVLYKPQAMYLPLPTSMTF